MIDLMKKQWFCNAWPDAKEVLEFMRDAAPTFWQRVALRIIIAAGNTLAKDFCPDTAP